ncbi:RNA polymerase sigma factor [Amycolatopsis jejuensis]|uniref:RNA polymerase sigma factor n=1 Tax=Amycolatopsis jejuensis TaxID=330084 RepID=UPI000525D8DC|nr:RNA polymerase sigma factor [Amycolatopsis jejuensis]
MPADVPGSPDGDQGLWEQAATGDVQAFGVLFDRHAAAVWNYAYRLTGSWATAEDLTSLTFLTAWRRLREVTLVNDSARPWLYTVTANLARREQRRLGRFAAALTRLPRAAVVRDHAEDVAGRVDADRRLRTVLGAVAKLPRAERRAVELCLLGSLSTADAAAVLGIAEPSVRARISRARSRLRTFLQDTDVLTGEEF